MALGGRWYYDPEPGLTERPAKLTVTHANADRLFYRDSRLTNPFAENMTAWLRKGYLDLNGQLVRRRSLHQRQRRRRVRGRQDDDRLTPATFRTTRRLSSRKTSAAGAATRPTSRSTTTPTTCR